MNTANLHELINRYEEKLDVLYNSEHDELFKWKAMKVWRDEWFKPEDAFTSFTDRFTAARREFSLFIDNSRMHPSSGVIKLWEKEPETVEHLFRDILFADAHGDVNYVQDNMDGFIDEYEQLRQKYFPRNWSFKMDRHAASVFIAMNNPDFNYVYKASEAQAMARYTDFGSGIGSGIDFNLAHYYRLCETVVSALKEHPSLLEKHFARLTDEYYQDSTLHLLAFDLMYCSRAYNFYKGLIVPSPRRTTRKKISEPELTPEKTAQLEEKRSEIEQQIAELMNGCADYSDISLIGVQVTANIYGVGTVIAQEINKITVKFANTVKTFILDKKYPSRPRFEDDDIIVETFTEYGRKQEQIKQLERRLAALQ